MLKKKVLIPFLFSDENIKTMNKKVLVVHL